MANRQANTGAAAEPVLGAFVFGRALTETAAEGHSMTLPNVQNRSSELDPIQSRIRISERKISLNLLVKGLASA
ncbi:hypothetical protein [Williamsia sp. 1135]|uniref:hypothetical protein n=1 Tax=Williamsia sp. 1135 TaxID=1889262 RepID=UPI000A1202D0|nr:hypothetical protein [Williamsia sp. 1135]ORM27680.1 hypothetical protein BFL43_21405 [Williamsia sp. 1135]